MHTTIYIISIFLLILLSAFFSGSETAITAVSKPKIRGLAKAGDKQAIKVNKLLEKKDKFLGSILLGNNIVNILSASLATSLLTSMYGGSGVAIATLIMTLLILIFAEVLPKTYALYHADKTALSIISIINFVIFILSPISNVILFFVRLILKTFNVKFDKLSLSGVEELRGAIDMHHAEAGESKENIRKEKNMLNSILDLDDVDVEEVMMHRKKVVSFDINQPVDALMTKISETNFSRIPLWEGKKENIIGVLHTKKLLKISQQLKENITTDHIKEILTEPWFIPSTTSLFDQLQKFKLKSEHFAVVVDEYGAFQGIITLEDILEEIVGDINDELDKKEKEVIKITSDTYKVNGTTTIRDLNRMHDWRLPDEDYSTIAGLILFETGTIPIENQKFTFFGFTFEILKMNKNQIMEIKIIKNKDVEND
jgi:Mg2+/Co2+ transporter CorB